MIRSKIFEIQLIDHYHFQLQKCFHELFQKRYLDFKRQIKHLFLHYDVEIAFWKKTAHWAVRKRSSLIDYCCEARVICFFRALSFSGWSETSDKCDYGWATVVGMQSGPSCADSLEILPSWVVIRGLSIKFFGKIKKYCFKGS